MNHLSILTISLAFSLAFVVVGATWISESFATSTNASDTNATLQSESTARLNVVTSVSPITNIVENVGGNRINFVGLVPEGFNSHTFELVPSDIVKVNNATLVIIDGLGLETNVEQIADQARSKNPQLQILKLADNTITPDQQIFDFSFPKEGGDPNPHLWLNVAYAMKFANLTRDKLIEMATLYRTSKEVRQWNNAGSSNGTARE
jgi:ABC-type Zn uptake system ZnuABC Zn-binding protein ZnuA